MGGNILFAAEEDDLGATGALLCCTGVGAQWVSGMPEARWSSLYDDPCTTAPARHGVAAQDVQISSGEMAYTVIFAAVGGLVPRGWRGVLPRSPHRIGPGRAATTPPRRPL